jgi:hypothetical protein
MIAKLLPAFHLEIDGKAPELIRPEQPDMM